MSPMIRSATAASRAATNVTAKAKTSAAGKVVRGKKVPGAKSIVRKLLPGFSRQLAAMLSAGMPIVASLEALRQQSEHPSFKQVIGQVKQGIENGLAFSDALKSFPSVFNQLFVNMVRGGESGGQLAETMNRIADFLEKSAKLRRKVKSAMSYPVAVMLIATVLAVGMLVFIVPVFAEMFDKLGGDLPLPTKIMMMLSNGLQKHLPIVVPVIGLLGYLFKKWKETDTGAMVMAKFYLKIPVVGPLIQKVAMARFARTLGQLIHSGVPILTALEICSGATGNKVIEQAVLDGRQSVEKGENLSTCLATKSCFAPILVHMLAAGEKTGKVDEMMDNIAAFYEDEVDAMLSGLTALIEPLLMVFLGITIGSIVVCMFLPIFNMHSLVTK